ncbi:MAG TPA: hypothetical protein VJH92_01555 [Candidatus Nanoarchaeia archaeon]|nr:hypothetical protein [Candidatus Nanoarchaeia archaeon]
MGIKYLWQAKMKMMKSNKGLSAVVATLLLVLLTITLVGIVWGVMKELVDDGLPPAECIDVYGKLTFSDTYTCYNVSSNEVHLSISLSDVAIEKALIGVSSQGTSKSFELKTTEANFLFLRPYGGSYNAPLKLPDTNSGLTYIYNLTTNGFSGRPDSLRMVPGIDGKLCETEETISDIGNC